MNRTAINYLTHTWNPIAMRCTPVSEGCDHCWHLGMARRLAANPSIGQAERDAYAGCPPWLVPKRLVEPLHMTKPARIGVQFMGDLFHDDVPFPLVDKVYAIMALCPQHDFLLLTKRDGRMVEYFNETGCPANVWLGVTVELPKHISRLASLVQIEAPVHFISAEPMLEQLWLPEWRELDWVICGGESGHGRRQMEPAWPRSLRDQCRAANVPFYFKGWGDWAPFRGSWSDYPWRYGKGKFADWLQPTECCPRSRTGWHYCSIPGGITVAVKVGKKKAGRLLDGVEHNALPVTERTE